MICCRSVWVEQAMLDEINGTTAGRYRIVGTLLFKAGVGPYIKRWICG